MVVLKLSLNLKLITLNPIISESKTTSALKLILYFNLISISYSACFGTDNWIVVLNAKMELFLKDL